MNEKMLEELTLYLDGEHPDVVGFEEKMILDKELAQRCREYQAIGQGMRAMYLPQVQPAFTTRVLARLEDGPRYRLREYFQMWRWAALAPACVVVIAAGVWWAMPTTREAQYIMPPASEATAIVAGAAKWSNDDAVIEELAALLAQGVDAETLYPDDSDNWYEDSDEDLGEIFQVSAVNWEMDRGMYGEENLSDVMSGMKAEEIEALESMLSKGSIQ